MSRCRAVIPIVMNEDDLFDGAADVRPDFLDRISDNNCDIVRDRCRRYRAIAWTTCPCSTTNIVRRAGITFEAGNATADESAHEVIFPPLRAPEIHHVADSVRFNVADHEQSDVSHYRPQSSL